MKHHRTLAASLIGICLLCVIARVDSAEAPAPLADRTFASHVKIILDPRAASDYGVDPKKVDSVINEFIAKHDSFTLDDLQNLKISTGPDKNLLLSEIATIDVQFDPVAAKQ